VEENVISAAPAFKLYKDRSISMATFLGGPLVAGYLTADNFKKLGQSRKAGITWLISITFTLLMIAIIFLIPELENIPNYVIPLFYTAVTQTVVQKLQGPAIEAHIDAGGQTYSSWRAAGIGLLGLLILTLLIILIVLLLDESAFQ